MLFAAYLLFEASSLHPFQSEDPTRANPVMATDDAAASSTNSGGNLDFLGQEMADLQELLVSMATGKGIEIEVVHPPYQ